MQKFPLAIVAALDDELKIIYSKFDIDAQVRVRPALFTTGKYSGRSLLLVKSGVGSKAMAEAISYCIDRYRPGLCLHVGYCGAADPYYQPGDLLIASAVVDAVCGERIKSDDAFVRQAEHLCDDKKMRARIANLVTVGGVISTPHEKAFVGTQHDAQGIDMESFALAKKCHENSMPYLIVRAVLDPLDVALPDMSSIVDREGETDGMALVGHMIKKPKDIFGLPRFAYFASEARRAMTAFVDAWIGASPGPKGAA